MSLAQIFKKVLIPCAAGVANATNEGHTYGPNCVKKPESGTKPSDLPIYAKECSVCRETNQPAPPPSSMEETVGNIRKELWVWQDNLKGYRHRIVDVYRKGFSQADSAVEYLRQPANGPHRAGAIIMTGLAGYILGMRRGRIRRVLYGTIGALGMASVCYPEEASEALESVVLEGRRYFIIAYHFVCGESPKAPEWLEKFIGPLVPKESDAKPNETKVDLKKIKDVENEKSNTKEKKA